MLCISEVILPVFMFENSSPAWPWIRYILLRLCDLRKLSPAYFVYLLQTIIVKMSPSKSSRSAWAPFPFTSYTFCPWRLYLRRVTTQKELVEIDSYRFLYILPYGWWLLCALIYHISAHRLVPNSAFILAHKSSSCAVLTPSHKARLEKKGGQNRQLRWWGQVVLYICACVVFWYSFTVFQPRDNPQRRGMRHPALYPVARSSKTLHPFPLRQ